MTKASEKFEQQIQRIYDLVEQPGSDVTWDDHIPDPDNPKQSRQIDITIRRGKGVSLVECRIHKDKQDVTWIEELIGRKASLRAEAVIAVSASGFTDGAIAKAEAFGIILRDMLSLTESEIREWGRKTQVALVFYEFRDVELTFFFDCEDAGKVGPDDIEREMRSMGDVYYCIFENTATEIERGNPDLRPCRFEALVSREDMKISGVGVAAIQFEADFRTVEQELRVPTVKVYGAPGIEALRRNAFVEVVELGEFEITQCGDEVNCVIDLSAINTPLNCLFRGGKYDFTRTVTMHSFTIVGNPKWQISACDLGIRVRFMTKAKLAILLQGPQ